MQTVTRGVNESLVLGDEIRITVLQVLEDRVCIEIHAPELEPSYRIETLYLPNNAHGQQDDLFQAEFPHEEFATVTT